MINECAGARSVLCVLSLAAVGSASFFTDRHFISGTVRNCLELNSAFAIQNCEASSVYQSCTTESIDRCWLQVVVPVTIMVSIGLCSGGLA